MPFQDALTGVVIENHEGRPTKVEGNEMHPASHGASSKFNQASMLQMYAHRLCSHSVNGRDRTSAAWTPD
jgi:molybdopterin-containing oxidoreductase family iron-sulfur binding subunit